MRFACIIIRLILSGKEAIIRRNRIPFHGGALTTILLAPSAAPFDSTCKLLETTREITAFEYGSATLLAFCLLHRLTCIKAAPPAPLPALGRRNHPHSFPKGPQERRRYAVSLGQMSWYLICQERIPIEDLLTSKADPLPKRPTTQQILYVI